VVAEGQYQTPDTISSCHELKFKHCYHLSNIRITWMFYTIHKKGKAVPLHAMEALGGRGVIAPTHSRPRQ
jgi:hypothetical protein